MNIQDTLKLNIIAADFIGIMELPRFLEYLPPAPISELGRRVFLNLFVLFSGTSCEDD